MNFKKLNPLNSNTLIVLAGGKSSRMAIPKGLLIYKDNYWLEEQLQRALNADFKLVVLVLGYDHHIYFKELPFLKNGQNTIVNYKGLNVRLIINQNPQLGAFSSLVLALKAVENKNYVFVLPIDVPLVEKSELKKMKMSQTMVTIPKYKQQRGHPVKLSHDFWKLLMRLDDKKIDFRLDHQIKKLNDDDIKLVVIDDIQAIYNLNSPELWHDFLLLKKMN